MDLNRQLLTSLLHVINWGPLDHASHITYTWVSCAAHTWTAQVFLQAFEDPVSDS